MHRSRLRVFYGPETTTEAQAPTPPAPTVRLALRDVFPALADAARGDRLWLQDFADDEITISADLYEVILAYQYRRQAAAR